MWAYKRQNIGNEWYKFAPKGYIPLSIFFTKFGKIYHALVVNLTIITFKMWAYSTQNRRNW